MFPKERATGAPRPQNQAALMTSHPHQRPHPLSWEARNGSVEGQGPGNHPGCRQTDPRHRAPQYVAHAWDTERQAQGSGTPRRRHTENQAPHHKYTAPPGDAEGRQAGLYVDPHQARDTPPQTDASPTTAPPAPAASNPAAQDAPVSSVPERRARPAHTSPARRSTAGGAGRTRHRRQCPPPTARRDRSRQTRKCSPHRASRTPRRNASGTA